MRLTGCSRISARIGRTPSRFGDAAVDIPMLEYCAVGVAMGNGSEDIKAMAGIVAGDVEEDGLARAFERLGLM